MENWEDTYKKVETSWEDNYSVFTNEKIDVAFYGGTKSLGFSEKDSNQYDTLIQSGASKEEAYEKTKIMVDVNGNKRHDMDVTNTKFKKFKLNDKNDIMDLSQFKNMGVRETFKTTLGETITHPTLFKNYPFLKDIPLWLINDRKKGYQGAYYGASDKWEGRLGGKLKDGSPTRIEYNTAYVAEHGVMRTMIEEIQHLIDDYEDDRPYGTPVADKGDLGLVETEANAESLQDQYDAYINSGEDETKIPPYFVDGKVDSKKYEEQFVQKGGKNDRPFLGLYYVKIDKDNELKNIYTNNYDDLLLNAVNIVYYQQKEENPKLSDEEFNKHLIKHINTKTLFPKLGVEMKLGDNGKLTYGEIKKKEDSKVQEEPSTMMPSVYKWEGSYQQMKGDRGNYTTSGKLIGTNKGISAKTLETYLGREPTVDDMKNLDQETVSTIYKEEFYDRYKIYKLPEELQTVAMHALVTGGPKTIKYIQELAGTKQDMLIGDKTIKALKDKGITAEQLKNKVLSEYKEFNSWKDFGNGWTNRFNDIIGKGWTERFNLELNGYN